jgi:hypothetical protein
MKLPSLLLMLACCNGCVFAIDSVLPNGAELPMEAPSVAFASPDSSDAAAPMVSGPIGSTLTITEIPQ